MQGPEIWLNQLGVKVACVVDASADAILDEAHRVFVNYEAYYTSSAKAREAFALEPWRYTDLVTDPISHERFQPDGKSPTTEHNGRRFYFSSAATAQTFGQDPASYATPVVPYAGRM